MELSLFRFARGSIARIEIAAAKTGKATRTEYYEHAALVRAEEDSDGDGKIDKWETYAGDHLASVAFDTAHRGFADRRLIYELGGSARVGYDAGEGVRLEAGTLASFSAGAGIGGAISCATKSSA